MSLKREDYVKMIGSVLEAANTLDIPAVVAQKAHTIERENVVVSEKITFKNFYKNMTFWKALGLSIAAGATGNYAGAVTSFVSAFGFGA